MSKTALARDVERQKRRETNLKRQAKQLGYELVPIEHKPAAYTQIPQKPEVSSLEAERPRGGTKPGRNLGRPG